jgi:hypothetical protein
MPKYVALEGLKEGNRFYTSYDPDKDPTKLNTGEVAYKVLGFADTDREAKRLVGWGLSVESDRAYMANYLFESGQGLFDRESCARFACMLSPTKEG